MKRIIITGPTGTIGMALIQKCLGYNIEVAAVCHRSSERISRIPVSDLVRIVECDLDELRTLPGMLQDKYDAFFHLAWACTKGIGRNDTEAQVRNIRYTLDAADTAKELGCECFIGAGSQAEYGRYEGKLNSEVPTFPEHGYGIAKLCAGQMSRIRCEQLEIRHIWFRILSIYGKYDGERTMVMSSVRSMLSGESPEYTPAEQKWDFLYCDDAAEALLLAAQKGKDGAIYCLGSGEARPLREYIEIMRDEINPDLPLKLGAKPYADKQVMHLCADITDLQRDTGFVPRYSFEEGIRETIQWARQ